MYVKNKCDFSFDCVAGVCIPLSVPECQAVGRSSTMFPNLFGHTTLEDANTVFAIFKRDEFCSQNAMYYLCSLVYPVCSGGVRINPCQSYCDGKSLFNWHIMLNSFSHLKCMCRYFIQIYEHKIALFLYLTRIIKMPCLKFIEHFFLVNYWRCDFFGHEWIYFHVFLLLKIEYKNIAGAYYLHQSKKKKLFRTVFTVRVINIASYPPVFVYHWKEMNPKVGTYLSEVTKMKLEQVLTVSHS